MTASWDLKLNRAEHHLKEVDLYVTKYAKAHPYKVVPVKGKVEGKQIVRYVLRFTEQPHEMLPVVIGDVVHNIRSAMDHVVVATMPRKVRRNPWACFPLFSTRPFDTDGKPLDTEDGERWAKFAANVPQRVRAQVEILQPYHIPSDPAVLQLCRESGLEPSEIHGLGLLQWLDNADKHRQLIALGKGLIQTEVTISTTTNDRPPAAYCLVPIFQDGTEITRAEIIDPALFGQGKVKVNVRGATVVAVNVRGNKGGIEIPNALGRLIQHGREIAGFIAPFAKP